MEYGLVGETLAHSYSKHIHASLAGYSYELVELPPDALDIFLQKKEFKGINVTIPYKQRVMAFCDEIDPMAREIGAVNTVVNRGGKLTGYNTDWLGFCAMVRHSGVPVAGKTALLLGNGASTKTVTAALQKLGVGQVLVASRTAAPGLLRYEEAAARADMEILVNCSPAGMYPHNGVSLIDPGVFPRLAAVFDLVYNPFKTKLLLDAEQCGVPAVNGLFMLVAQAKAAAELFLDTAIPEEKVAEICRKMVRKRCNISLIGMPGSGKTSLGQALAQRLGKRFVDLDAEIEREAGKSIPQLFAAEGEAAFRDRESRAAVAAGKESGQVLSTGGGIVLRGENIAALRQNGPVLFIDCPVELLAISDGRPLAKCREDLARLERERLPLYRAAADGTVAYHKDFAQNVRALEEKYQRLICHW